MVLFSILLFSIYLFSIYLSELMFLALVRRKVCGPFALITNYVSYTIALHRQPW